MSKYVSTSRSLVTLGGRSITRSYPLAEELKSQEPPADSQPGHLRYDTKASGNWYKADEPWGAFLQSDGNPAVTIHPYESDASSGSFNPQAHTTWVPVDWSSWPNYNVHGYGVY
eukprot:762796-Hanusia_phi.AAC.4